jgi:hypothetical protein
MAWSNVPNRWKGLAVGMVGGIAGTFARRYYERKIAPRFFPPLAPPDYLDASTSDPVEQRAWVMPQYQDDETMLQATARVFYKMLKGREPRSTEAKTLSEDVTEMVWGIVAGAGYGSTRTTTRARDIAGGFFLGIRLWLIEIVGGTLLGFRPGPTRYSIDQHAHLLTVYWVFTFTMTAVTRALYRLLSPEDWF